MPAAIVFTVERLGQPGDAFKQKMTVGQQSQQKTIHQILLPDHNVTDLLPDRWNPLAQLSNFLRIFLRRFIRSAQTVLAARMFDSNRDQLPTLTLCFCRTFERRDGADPF